MGGGALTKPCPIGMARSRREIKNLAGTGLTDAFAKGIPSGALKFIGIIPLLNYTVL